MAALSNNMLALMSGNSWVAQAGRPTSISYTIRGEDTVDRFGRTVSTVDPLIAQSIALAVAEWNKLANVDIHFVANSTVESSNPFATDIEDIQLIFETDPVPPDGGNIIGSTNAVNASDSLISGGAITLDNRVLSPEDFLPGPLQSGFAVIVRAVGMALGLSNPDDEAVIPSFNENTMTGNDVTLDGTIMAAQASYGTYTAVAGIPLSAMIYDIAILQFMYGANHNYNPGNDTYSFSGAQLAETIWDGAGTDTLDFSTLTSAVTIDLQESIDNVTIAGLTRLWIAVGANIENGTGGSAADAITGNALGNLLRGNAGDDDITGNSGNDSVRGGRGDDTVTGNGDDDQLFGDRGVDSLRGGQGADIIHGGKSGDVLLGDAGADVLYGELGNDTITGGTESDTFVFSTGSGVDTITDFEDGDILQFSASVFATAVDAVTASSSGGGNVSIDLGDGNSITLTGITSISTSDVVIA